MTNTPFDHILTIVLAGLAGTAAMTVVLYAIHALKLANADMMRAIGSLITKSEQNAMPYGIVIHFSMGIVFAFLYAALTGLIVAPTFIEVLTICTGAGVFHGLVVAMALAILVAEHHPLPRFQKAGVGVMVAHLVGHIFYGFSVGLVLANSL